MAAFVLLFLFILGRLTPLFMHKQIEGRWNMTAKIAGFYNEPPHSIDVMILGSSHAYCSVDPARLEEETGLTSYVLATQLQPLWITYHYMVEVLKTQRPKLLAVEVYMSVAQEDDGDEASNHTAIDPLPFSRNKVDLIRAALPPGQRRYYLFPIMKYHDRWESLEVTDFERDYEGERDPDRGYVRLTETAEGLVFQDVSQVKEAAPGTEKSLIYLRKMVDLARQEDLNLVFFKSPANATPEEKVCYNSVAQLAAELGVPYLDYNDPALYEAVGLDVETDFYDVRHLNEEGMKKFVRHFSRWLMENLGGS